MMEEPDYSVLDRGGLSAGVFFPRPDPSLTPTGATDHMVAVGDGVEIAARRYVTDPTGPTIVYFHGNGEVAGDHDGIAPLYHSIGANLFVFEFRGYGRSSGTPAVEHLVRDGATCAEAAQRMLDADGFTGPRYVMGRSLGASPALEAAARVSGFRGLVLESGAGNIERFLHRFGMERDHAVEAMLSAHASKLRAITIPTLFIHGLADDLVPVENAVTTAGLLTSSSVTNEFIEGAGHNDLLLIDPGRYISAIAELISTTA